MTQVRRMDHVGIVVGDLHAATEFFLDIGLEKEGGTAVDGDWVDSVVGLSGVREDVVMVRTPDGAGKLELIKFHAPADAAGPAAAAPNRLGIRHVAFVVDDLDTLLDTLRGKGFGTVGEVRDYADVFRLCCVRGPEGLIVELAQQLGG